MFWSPSVYGGDDAEDDANDDNASNNDRELISCPVPDTGAKSVALPFYRATLASCACRLVLMEQLRDCGTFLWCAQLSG
jgi:hypothetical protein